MELNFFPILLLGILWFIGTRFWPCVHETGVTLYDRERAFDGFTLWAPLEADNSGIEPWQRPGMVYLMNMNGDCVHSWNTPFPVCYARLEKDGHIVTGMRSGDASDPERPGIGGYPMGGATGWLWELDWEGNTLFSHFDPCMHHDFRRLENGNYIYLGWEKVPADLALSIRGGFSGSEHAGGVIFSDYIREIDPSGNITWEWHATGHMDTDTDIIGPIHPRKEWSHMNNLAPMEDGNIMSSSRFLDMAFIIERATGRIVWRWGNAAFLDRKSGQVLTRFNEKTLGGPHDFSVIERGLPGEGHMLGYDNGMYTGVSRALEVDIDSGEIVWQSTDHTYRHGRHSFSAYISSANRLSNGNTLICEGQNGIICELTPDRQIVWQWVRPEPSRTSTVWAIFRSYRFAPDYCPQLKDLCLG